MQILKEYFEKDDRFHPETFQFIIQTITPPL